MKARPRSVENRVADELNKFFEQSNLSSVERIPVLGRAGPDITWNELQLIVDVKSRLSNPKMCKITRRHAVIFDSDMASVGVRLKDIDLLFMRSIPTVTRKSSKTVNDWLAHMDDWTIKNHEEVPYGVSAIVLHWPNTYVENSTLLIYKEERGYLRERYNSLLTS